MFCGRPGTTTRRPHLIGPPGSGTSLLGCKKTHSFHKHQRLGFHQDPPCRREVETDEGGKAGKDTFSCCTVGNFWPTGVCVALLNTHTGQLEAPPTTDVSTDGFLAISRDDATCVGALVLLASWPRRCSSARTTSPRCRRPQYGYSCGIHEY